MSVTGRNIKKIYTLLLVTILTLLGLAGLVLGIPRFVTELYSQSKSYPSDTVPPAPVAIVFGAGLTRNGTPSTVLQDRIKTAASLYFSGKVEKILMSGDNRFLDYNEPGAMFNYATELGVPPQAIVLDFAGRRTYDTCYRASAIFSVQEAILVTQDFHLPRALFTCNMLGVKSVGVAADQRQYQSIPSLYWHMRELPATVTALWEVLVSHPLPVLGDPEPIFPDS